jgi:hypothetical protein
MPRREVAVQMLKRGAGAEVLPGLRAFKWIDFAATVDNPDVALTGRLMLQGHRGPYSLTRLSVDAGVGLWPGGLTAELYRAVPVDKVVTAVLAEYGTEPGTGDVRTPAWGSGREIRRRGIEDADVLALVALVYMAALLSGGNPAEAVAARLECSPASAARYVQAAKRHGPLRPTDRSV